VTWSALFFKDSKYPYLEGCVLVIRQRSFTHGVCMALHGGDGNMSNCNYGALVVYVKPDGGRGWACVSVGADDFKVSARPTGERASDSFLKEALAECGGNPHQKLIEAMGLDLIHSDRLRNLTSTSIVTPVRPKRSAKRASAHPSPDVHEDTDTETELCRLDALAGEAHADGDTQELLKCYNIVAKMVTKEWKLRQSVEKVLG
jgi:hypothetical protein